MTAPARSARVDQVFGEVDAFLSRQLSPNDAALQAALDASDDAGLSPIQVPATQGKLLAVLATAVRAERVLEIGTLGGYSTIWLARALPAGGRVVTLEADPRNAEVARHNLEVADVADRVEVRLGPALDTLPELEAEGAGPFDLVFIDANKDDNPDYLRWALRLARPGTVIVLDNVVRAGAVLDDSGTDAAVVGTREALAWLAAEPRVLATALQTVGAKGHDGLAVAVVLPGPT
jgi:predicted O-methyltransferase YrrM